MVPANLEAEEGVLGCMLNSREAIAVAQEVLGQEDFFSPEHGSIFSALTRLWQAGLATDAISVRDAVNRDSGGITVPASSLLSLQSSAPSTSAVGSLCLLVARDSLSRKLWQTGYDMQTATEDPKTDPAEYLEELQRSLASIDNPTLHLDPGDVTFDALRARPPIRRKPWIVPGLMRQDWRMLLVGREGDGKSYLLQQIAVASSYGVHPFTHKEITPAQVLLIDLENPDDEIQERIERIATVCERSGAASGGGRLWHRPGGIDLRKRVDRTQLEEVLRKRRPNLVVLGPLYKAYSRLASENDEQVASEIQRTLDDLRTRYGFAIMCETHAPKGDSGSTRELVPFGSSLWLRWSELGLKMVPWNWKKRPDTDYYIGRFRGDRVTNDWPTSVHHGPAFPFDARWEEGYKEYGVADQLETA